MLLRTAQGITALALVVALLTPSSALGQANVFPYSYSFDTGAQSPLTGDGNWSVASSSETPTWNQSTPDGSGNGLATLKAFKGIGRYSSLTLRLNTAGIYFVPPSRWTLKLRRYGSGTPPGDENALVTFSWADQGGPSLPLGDAVSFVEIPEDHFREILLSLPPEFWARGPVSLTITVTSHHNAYIHGGLELDDWMVVSGSSGGGDLPVELRSFSASQARNGVCLQWSTASETSNFGFDVERRAMGASMWAKIGFVPGSGTTSSEHTYTYLDAAVAFGRYAYRLKQIDLDGSFSYSFVTEADAGTVPSDLLVMQNFPNPFNPSTVIRFMVSESGPARLRVFNTLGMEIATLFEGRAETGVYYERMFDAPQLPSGVYFSILESGGARRVQKMILTK